MAEPHPTASPRDVAAPGVEWLTAECRGASLDPQAIAKGADPDRVGFTGCPRTWRAIGIVGCARELRRIRKHADRKDHYVTITHSRPGATVPADGG